jgi:hypothetical protein
VEDTSAPEPETLNDGFGSFAPKTAHVSVAQHQVNPEFDTKSTSFYFQGEYSENLEFVKVSHHVNL